MGCFIKVNRVLLVLGGLSLVGRETVEEWLCVKREPDRELSIINVVQGRKWQHLFLAGQTG